MRQLRPILFAVFVPFTAVPTSVATEVSTFDQQIRPLLATHCYSCHGPGKAEGGLRLDTSEWTSDANYVTPGTPDESLILRRVSDSGGERMPPPSAGTGLKKNDVSKLRKWIRSGAHWQPHWSNAPVERPKLAGLVTPGPNTPTDSAIRCDELGSNASRPPATSKSVPRHVWLRRVHVALTGLNPSPSETKRFMADRQPNAKQRVVDRLLSSPEFGEHWATWWLDQARYADSNGYERDRNREMTAYRDWVVQAFNASMPLDRFAMLQLAGDLIKDAQPSDLIATAFNRNTVIHDEMGVNEAEFKTRVIKNRVETFATVFLGMNISCAQCHDHRSDAVSQSEYYSLYAFFQDTTDRSTSGNMSKFDQSKFDDLRSIAQSIVAELSRELKQLKSPTLTSPKPSLNPFIVAGCVLVPSAILGLCFTRYRKLTWVVAATASALILFPTTFQKPTKKADSDSGQLHKRREWLKQQIALYSAPELPSVLVMNQGPPTPTFVQLRGQWDTPGPQVSANVPSDLGYSFDENPNRLGLAKWLTSPANPRFSRTMANRIWCAMFGRGICRTDGDLGASGDQPSHPKLLDQLASNLKSDWDLKRHLREICLSQAFAAERKSARSSQRSMGAPTLHLSAESIRDIALQASHLLDRRVGGPCVFPAQPSGVWSRIYVGNDSQMDNEWPLSQNGDAFRRSIYTFRRRAAPHPFLQANGAPNRRACVTNRPRPNLVNQALAIMNSGDINSAAASLAAHVRVSSDDLSTQIAEAFRRLLVRNPRPKELESLLVLAQDMETSYQESPALLNDLRQACLEIDHKLDSRWASLYVVASTLFSTREFLVVP